MRHSLIGLIGLFAACLPLPAQAFSWSELTPSPEPSPRIGHAMVYDSSQSAVVLFGGSGATVFQDTWKWNGSAWQQQTPSTMPPSRKFHAMAYDIARGQVVLFGGTSAAGLHRSDTWLWDGTDWAATAPAAAPSGRYGHAMAYDVISQRVLLFGGTDDVTVFSDTWAWDGTAWSELSPTSSPPPRQQHAMAFDSGRSVIVMFGGIASGVRMADSWEWTGTNWQAMFTNSYPTPRDGHTLGYDAQRARTVLFGGEGNGTTFDDTWEYDGDDWTLLSSAVSPPPMSRHASAYDAQQGHVVILGQAIQGGSYTTNMWANVAAGPPSQATTFGSGCGTPALQLSPAAQGAPIIGGIGRADILNAPTSIGAMSIGWNNSTYGPFVLPVTLASIGMDGCDLLISADVMGLPLIPIASNELQFQQPLPNNQSLLGTTIYLQAYVLAPGENELQLVVSNGLAWTLGNT